jgi:hypothetical protein
MAWLLEVEQYITVQTEYKELKMLTLSDKSVSDIINSNMSSVARRHIRSHHCLQRYQVDIVDRVHL